MTQPTPMNIVRVLIVRIDRANRVRYFANFALADFFVRLNAFIRIVFSFTNPYRSGRANEVPIEAKISVNTDECTGWRDPGGGPAGEHTEPTTQFRDLPTNVAASVG